MQSSTDPGGWGPTAVAEGYGTDRFSELYYGSRNPPEENLGLAARFLCAFFRRHGIPFALLGGWAVYLRGSGRQTEDVDVTVTSSMDALKTILMTERRVCVPQVHGTTCIQVFIHTGGDWDPDFPNTRPFTISADIIMNGHLGTPPDLATGTESLQPVPNTTQGQGVVPVIDIYHQLTSKLQAHYARRAASATNDYRDLMFLIETYPSSIWSFRHFLNDEHRRAFYSDFSLNNAREIADFVAHVMGIVEADG